MYPLGTSSIDYYCLIFPILPHVCSTPTLVIFHFRQFSFSSMLISLVSVPVILTFETESIPFSGKVVLAAVTFMIGVSTTVIIN